MTDTIAPHKVLPTPAGISEGTHDRPIHHDGLQSDEGGVHQRRRYFSYEAVDGLVTGTATSITFDIDRPAAAVWTALKDFNAWQNSYHHHYSGVVGDMEGQVVRSTLGGDLHDPRGAYGEYRIDRVIPEYLIVLSQIVPADKRVGGMGGYSVFMLSEFDDITTVSIMIQHDRLTPDLSLDAALDYWRAFAPELLMKWRDHFVPNLRRLAMNAA